MFQNPWFVGIAGGLVSSVLGFFITSFISSKFGKKEYLKKVDQANNEVITLLRRAVSEGEFPNKAILDSIINATSRNYKIESNDMYDGPAVLENLIREVFDTSFIATNKKIESSHELIKVKKQYEEMLEGIVDKPIVENFSKNSNKNSLQQLISTMSLSIALLLILVFIKLDDYSSLLFNIDNKMIMMIISMLTIIMTLPLIMILKIRLEKLTSSKKKNEEINNIDKP